MTKEELKYNLNIAPFRKGTALGIGFIATISNSYFLIANPNTFNIILSLVVALLTIIVYCKTKAQNKLNDIIIKEHELKGIKDISQIAVIRGAAELQTLIFLFNISKHKNAFGVLLTILSAAVAVYSFSKITDNIKHNTHIIDQIR